MVLECMAVLPERRLVGLGALLRLPVPPARLVVLNPSPSPEGDFHARERRYPTHAGRSSGPLTGDASMLSRPA
ncbi:MAG: hypothetical protein LBB75_03560 [Oscillospiraceae bacterium]|nr:hypothetical protein [Oscillospiraceae bacterium]